MRETNVNQAMLEGGVVVKGDVIRYSNCCLVESQNVVTTFEHSHGETSVASHFYCTKCGKETVCITDAYKVDLLKQIEDLKKQLADK